ncbi:LysR family transcriptional regulator [Sediminicoccus rosea]|jgi:DNA-binding transcriptional LysR family regulator|uniref:LysR family transcriptional regulator n=1 Tax=Sediminicoccus rosea TaxID=1225128 RepID=A0ABZ0PGV4_9PROT|nr:LysR family transcriptional regulator [Sediminicoccus rosea]WPB84860.1 LysR family transcriptional regulator [Sediminicoccus rosea]
MSAFAGIEAFVRVVEAGSFTTAAQRLQTAKSSVSAAVRGLEERLGVRLLDRSTRRVEPTEAGRVFYARCRRLLEEEAAARLEAQSLQEMPAGRLRVAAPECFAARHLVPGLASFLAQHPAVELELAESPGNVRLVEDGFDLAIRVVETPAEGMVVRRLATSRVVIVAAPGYLAQHGAPLVPGDVAAHRCVGFAPLAWRDTWRLGGESVPVRPVLLTDNTETLRAAALAGVGLAAVPDWAVADALAAGLLQRVLPDHRAAESGIFAVYPTNRLMIPKVRAFVDHVAAGLRARGLAG